MKIRLKCPLAEKSRWRHIRLAIKPGYLGNHASQIKSYYGTLSGSHGRSFRFRHENLPEAPPSEEITMTPYLACNETSLSRKPCITNKKFLWITIRKSCSLFQNASWIIIWSAKKSWRCHIWLAIKPCYLRNPEKKLLWNAIRKLWSLFHNPSWKIAWSTPWRPNPDDVISGLQKISLSRKPCFTDKKLQWITFMKSLSLSNFFIKKQQILFQKTYQFINVVNGVSHSHKTANIFFSFDSVA